MARLETSPEHPAPVRVIAQRIAGWINRLGEVWVDGQIAQLTRRPGLGVQFLTLRDPDANISLTVTCASGVLGDGIAEGSRVVLRARPDFYVERGTLSLRASEIRQVGLGELLARLEQLRRVLAAEGLFAAAHKRPLPFLPRRIGLITGRASAAERDVVENARRRLPAAAFRIENVATQGANAVGDLLTALRALDDDASVEVIVIARGGGSVEDLLPFSNESLVRAVYAARTPVVSAVGHETDRPLLDLVADVAASTPTDAGKRIVPDLAAELRDVGELRGRARAGVQRRLAAESRLMAGVPLRLERAVRGQLDAASAQTDRWLTQARRALRSRLDLAAADVHHLAARLRTLSPQATLDRGYAVVRTESGAVVRTPDEAIGPLRVRVAGGEFGARRDR